MNYDDRFHYDKCATCGCTIPSGEDDKLRHHMWHKNIEKVIEIFEAYKDDRLES